MVRGTTIARVGRGGAAIRLRFSWGLVVVGLLAAVAGCESSGDQSGSPGAFLEVLQRSPFLPREAQLDLRKPESEDGRTAYSRPSRIVLGQGWSRISFAMEFDPEPRGQSGALSGLGLGIGSGLSLVGGWARSAA